MATFSAMTMHYSRFRIAYPEVECKTSRGVIILQTRELIFLIDIYVIGTFFMLHICFFRSWPDFIRCIIL
jgi:hypothetical protein